VKNRFVLIVILGISISLVSLQQAEGAIGYEWADKAQFGKPFFCILENPQFESYYYPIFSGAKDWEKELHETSTSQQELWDIDISMVTEKENYCETMTYIEPFGSNLAIPKNFTALGTGTASEIIIYIRDGQLQQQVRQVMTHEVGHAFGLGHYNYYSEAEKVAWEILEKAPSVMINNIHQNNTVQVITDNDIDIIKEIYGDGFVLPPKPKNHTIVEFNSTKQERQSEIIGSLKIFYGFAETIINGNNYFVEGQVLDDFGNPMSDVFVIVGDEKYPCNYKLDSSGYGDTNENGEFSVFVTPKGSNVFESSSVDLVACVKIKYGKVVSEPIQLFIDSPKIIIPREIEEPKVEEIVEEPEIQYDLKVEPETLIEPEIEEVIEEPITEDIPVEEKPEEVKEESVGFLDSIIKFFTNLFN